MRLSEPDGAIVMPHLHSALGENFSAGNTLTPAAYRDLLESRHPRLFSDALLLTQVLEHGQMDLTHDASPAELGAEPSLTLVAGGGADLFQRYELSAEQPVTGELRVNPLYRVERRGGSSILTLTFPTPEYRAGIRRMPAVPARYGDRGCGSDRSRSARECWVLASTICDAGASSSMRRRTTAESLTAQLLSFDQSRGAHIDDRMARS